MDRQGVKDDELHPVLHSLSNISPFFVPAPRHKGSAFLWKSFLSFSLSPHQITLALGDFLHLKFSARAWWSVWASCTARTQICEHARFPQGSGSKMHTNCRTHSHPSRPSWVNPLWYVGGISCVLVGKFLQNVEFEFFCVSILLLSHSERGHLIMLKSTQSVSILFVHSSTWSHTLKWKLKISSLCRSVCYLMTAEKRDF